VDTQTSQVATLPNADLRDEGRFGSHRAVAFDASGARMLYLRGGERAHIVLRDLSTGVESGVDPGPGLVWTAAFDPEGHGLEVVAIPSAKWPMFATTLAPRSCRGPVSSFSSFGGETPRRVLRYVPLDRGAAIESDDLLRMFGSDSLVRRKDASLALRHPDGSETEWVPPACHGTVQHADATRHALLVTCDGEHNGKAPLWFFGKEAAAIGEIYASKGDRVGDAPERFVQLDDLFVDMDAQRVIPGPPPIAPGRIRVIQDWQTRQSGVYVERSDGAVLRIAGQSKPATLFGLPSGPLVWRKPAPGR
jgi:hypothetical protein